ncbi:thioredoxin-disulfide reductase [Peptoniphilus sp. MSJ-1]|uniref:Thioredoxin reductase n=1 Tax=Peptoniphilus ovalis TaxID=2841503 RepID=A0ABS6FFU2_9FIRM|nr:thioredoxin-disulfide reductase [Peptoniphilus ovalis]MBU5668338.1 thioredoxin-disulfide reductase [Peptoniphilus ovalis]
MYDIIIIGGGPAGLTAGLYAARSKKKTLIIEKGLEGGQIAETTNVENYPGIDCIEGAELGKKMAEQAKKFGAKIVMDEVTDVELDGEVKKIKGYIEDYEAKTVIIATGASPREIGAPGEKEYKGRGVSYCSTCDAAFYEDEDVYVVGGGDSAVQEAIFITNFAKKVYIIHRRDELRASKDLQEKAFNNDKIDFIWNSQVKEIKGDKIVNEMILENTKTGEEKSIKSDSPFGIFVFIGYIPQTDLFKDKVEITEDGYIKTDSEMRTNVPGVFAAGDIRQKTVRQVVNAAGDGAVAAMNAQKYIDEEEGNLYEGFKA